MVSIVLMACYESSNITAQYIFANLFTGEQCCYFASFSIFISAAGVVVENFSYVFQLAGGAKAVDREQMRAFKKVWAEFANQRTGYLERPKFVPFFAVCSHYNTLCLVKLH